jgi:hypothetical protein
MLHLIVFVAKGVVIFFVSALSLSLILRWLKSGKEEEEARSGREYALLKWADSNGIDDFLFFRSDLSGHRTYHGIPRDRKKLRGLAELCLHGDSDPRERIMRPLKSLPDEIGCLGNLVVLDISVNELEELPEVIGELKHLMVLNAHANRIKHLPEEICQLKRLEFLYLSGNQLENLPESIADLENMRELNLKDNALTSLPEAIIKLQRISLLDIRGNARLRLNAKQMKWAMKIKQFLYDDDMEVTPW